MEWVGELFGTAKSVIAMAHIPALPGTPRYDEKRGISHLVEWVCADVAYLLQGGVDAIMFCNEDDRPYVFEAGIEQVAAMTRVVTEARPRDLPFGVDFLWDPMATMAIALATEAHFIREVLTGVYESDMGLWTPNAGKLARFQRQIGADHIRVFYNIIPEFASPLGSRSATQRARGAVVSALADVILVSGAMAGDAVEMSIIEEVKEAVSNTPVFVNTGVKLENVNEYLQVADGVIVGSSLKVDGYIWNPVDPDRVNRFMQEVHQGR